MNIGETLKQHWEKVGIAAAATRASCREAARTCQSAAQRTEALVAESNAVSREVQEILDLGDLDEMTRRRDELVARMAAQRRPVLSAVSGH